MANRAARATEIEAGAVTSIDALMRDRTGGLILRGQLEPLLHLRAHAHRRAALAGAPCVIVDGRVSQEPWRDLCLCASVDASLEPEALIQNLARASSNAVLGLLSVDSSGWGAELLRHFAAYFGQGSTRFSGVAPHSLILVHAGAGSTRVLVDVAVPRVPSQPDRRRFIETLVDVSKQALQQWGDYGAIERAWRGTGMEQESPARPLGLQAALLLRALVSCRGVVRREDIQNGVPWMDHAGSALVELEASGWVTTHHGWVRIARTEQALGLGEVSSGDRVVVAHWLAHHGVDSLARMRGIELLVGEGQDDVAVEATFRGVSSHVLRRDLWGRLRRCLGSTVSESNRLRLATLPLDLNDATEADEWLRGLGEPTSARHRLLRGRVLRARGDVAEAKRALEQALEVASSDERPRIALELAELSLCHQGDHRAARAYAELAREEAHATADGLAARNLEGKVLLAEERWSEAHDLFVAVEKDADRVGERVARLRARLNRAVVKLCRGRREEARSLLESVLEDGEATGIVEAKAFALSNLAVIAYANHELPGALRLTELAIDEMRAQGDAFRLTRQIVNLAELRRLIGQLPAAQQALSFARRALGEATNDPVMTHVLKVTAELRLASGDTFGAQDAIEEACLSAIRCGDGYWLGKCRQLAAQIALENGDVDGARRALDEAKQSKSGPKAVVEIAFIEAELARAEGRPFLELAADAADLARRHRQPEYELRAQVLWGEAERLQGRWEAAQSHHDEAADLVQQMADRLAPSTRESFLRRREFRGLFRLERCLRGDASNARASAITLAPAETDPLPPPESGERIRAAFQRLVGMSQCMSQLRRALARIGPSDAAVLIRGESGTGKELVADALQATSGRADGPFVKLNCAAIVEGLVLSELFGHERGAFTGAHARKAGRFEEADGGTLFLDEIGDISPTTQVALLRVLQEGKFERVGGNQTLSIDVRVVCATHRDLDDLVRQGRFREDLYYRLSGVTVDVPPLRDRLDDLPALCEALLSRSARERDTPCRVGDDAIELLAQHAWPGNIRELENTLRTAALFAETSRLGAADIRSRVLPSKP
ncbi:MAG: sigma 54-interacting transcriptional regulator, partial [Myxococcota bacterium]